ncbi:MAG: 4-hydroxy-tetrahydrodipicolinate reductase [Candidatus Glassbacteria bacterium]|nr:4-hydroxy-tetrahydrodipicolinate reductase [Candidatus Glassbacteria bacterium]
MLEITLVGAAGRMGQRIISAIFDSGDTRLAAAVEASGHRCLGQDAGVVAGVGPLKVEISDKLGDSVRKGGVAIDFSLPESAVKTAEVCAAQGMPLVAGVTGLSAGQKEALARAAEAIPLVHAPNMSVGVNLMFKVVGQVARVLGDNFDVEIVETHHRFKKDAPSGTANRLAEVIAEALDRDLREVACYGRRGITGERDRRQIAIHALRAGDVVGEHTVVFGAPGERFEVTHKAHSRDTFARGALVAARFAAGAGPGLYDMQDVLGLKD